MVNEATEAVQSRAISRRSGSDGKRMSRREQHSNAVVAALVVASALGGALAGCHPTGTAALDVIYSAAIAAAVTATASRSSRSVLLIFAAIGVILSRSWLVAPALVSLAVAFGSAFQRRPYRRINAFVGALGIQVILRWPPAWFHGLTAMVAAVAVIPVLVSGWKRLRSRTRRLTLLGAGGVIGLGVVLSIPVAVSALLARHPVTQGVALAKGALSQVESGQAPAATTDLRAAASDLSSARAKVGGWWNLGGYLVPVVAQQERALATATDAGANLTQVAAANGSKLDLQALRYTHGRIDLAALEAMGKPVAALDAAVTSAQRQLQSIHSGWLLSPLTHRLASLSGQVNKAKNSVDLAALGIRDVPGILGAHGVRHYFVGFMTPAETRGLGGFIGAYGVLTVDNGSIKLTASGRATQLAGRATKPLELVAPASYAARYGRFSPQTHFEDITYSPNFPTVEQVLAGMYPQVSGVHIDGVLMLDPYALAALLHFTGPISVPGLAGQLTSANAANVLLRSQYLTSSVSVNQRHDLLQGALSEGFRRLTSGSLPSPKALSAVLDPVARQGRLMFWSNHPGDQPLLERLGIAGAFPQRNNGGDLLAVTLDNAGNDKIDAYLHQSVNDQVRYDPSNGAVTARVTINLTNDAPSSGMPNYVIGNFSGNAIPPGTSYLWLTLYSPLQVRRATDNGEAAGFSPGVAENGVKAYSTYLQVYSKTTSTVTVVLSGHIRPGATYRMTTRLQPLANPQAMTVEAQPTPGWYANPDTAAAWSAGPDQVQHHSWSFGH